MLTVLFEDLMLYNQPVLLIMCFKKIMGKKREKSFLSFKLKIVEHNTFFLIISSKKQQQYTQSSVYTLS